MKLCVLDKLVRSDFNVKFLNALQQFWRNTKSFQCIDCPKKQDLFLYVDGFTITYKDKNNNCFIANSGDTIYVPTGSEYTVEISDAQNENAHTIGINFLLFDECGEQVVLSDNIKIFRSRSDKSVSMFFRQAIAYDAVRLPATKKILLMEILCAFASLSLQKNMPEGINNSLKYLSDHIEENPSISELAEMCYISEGYFRRQFKRCMGMSPVEYRNLLRIDKARQFLEYGEISVQEISDMLGYSGVSHFIKEFRKHYGDSPLRYRKSLRCQGGVKVSRGRFCVLID